MYQAQYNLNALPDFIKMQRVSFCWFIAKGLEDELMGFSKIYDFSYNTEYILFGQEYKLVKPVYSIVSAKKYAENYVAHLVIPLEVRNRKTNTVRYYKHFPIIKLPLMTNACTFIINGCERVIVSQIIRSPGIYFEKLKNQKKKKRNKAYIQDPIHKVTSFFPSGQPWKTNITLNSSIYDTKIRTFKKISSTLVGTELAYNLTFLKKKDIKILVLLKIYQIILKTKEPLIQLEKIKLFLYWVKFILKIKFKYKSFIYIVRYWNFIIKSFFNYKILKEMKSEQINLLNEKWWEKIHLKNLKQSKKKSFLFINFLSTNVLFAPNLKNYHNSLNFLNLPLIITESIDLEYLKTNKLTFYFSNTLKNLFKYQIQKISSLRPVNLNKISKYLLSKSKIIQFNEDHRVEDWHTRKYKKKELYSATLIPEFGSWIRFGFRKNTKINQYNYPIKIQEENLLIQLDKITQKPVLHLLKEIGLTDCEIQTNLQHSDFFYFDNPNLKNSITNDPLLRFNLDLNYSENISDFFRIFDGRYYRLGKIGRFRINNRLNLKINSKIETLTYEDIFAIIDSLITATITKALNDDIDHLKNRRVRSIGELIQNLFRVGFQRLGRKLRSQTNKSESGQLSSFNIIGTTLREFFGSSQLSQYMDQTNPLSSLTHRRRISALGPGGLDRDRISFAVRDIHPSHYGRICPIETPEGQNVGLIASLTTYARINQSGFLETPFWRVINGKVIKTEKPIYLDANIEDFYKIAPADLPVNNKNYLLKNSISIRYNQDFITVLPFDVDFIMISPIQVVSIATSLIPFFEHDDANRALMGSNMQRQSVPLLLAQKPIVGTGLENQIAVDSQVALTAERAGIVKFVSAEQILIKEDCGRNLKYFLQKFERSNQETCINQRPVVWPGERIESGQLLTDGPSISNNELALGQNVLVAYMPWQGYNFEDAILINERLIYEDIFTSIHIERYDIEIDQTSETAEQITKNIPNLNMSELHYLNDDGIVALGTFVRPGDILVGKIVAKNDSEQLPESKLLRAIFGAKAKGVKDTSFRMPEGQSGRVIERLTFNRKTKLSYNFEKIQIFIAQIRKIQVGDKIAGRHGNKGIISRILPRQDLPFLPDGTPVDIILNPLGVPSRMNVGQLYECLLGLAGHKLNKRFKILPFDEMFCPEASRILINKKLRQASVEKNEAWLFNPYSPGKIVLIDGRTGQQFDNPITVGNAYMLKLIHMVDDKMHSRSTGPYSLITQQPLGGKAQHGGQRFGEMEVWALEGFGAAFTLKELLTIKSDDMQGRNATLNAIVKGQIIPVAGVPESFKVLMQELRSIGLDMSTYQINKFSSKEKYDEEIDLIENYNPSTKIFPPNSNIENIFF